jgi:hypothetical protein
MTFTEAIAAAREGARSSGQAHLVRKTNGIWDVIEWDGKKDLRGHILILPDMSEYAVLDGEPWALCPERLRRLLFYRTEN